jgi:hypothetical protein
MYVEVEVKGKREANETEVKASPPAKVRGH